ncbi:hypothetical protein PCE1_001107 [Barthelona sp. PCE]
MTRKSKRAPAPRKKNPGLPTAFECPNCHVGDKFVVLLEKQKKNKVSIVAKARMATLKCKSCNFEAKESYRSYEHPVDIYTRFLDRLRTAKSESSERYDDYESEIPEPTVRLNPRSHLHLLEDDE